MHRWCVAAFVLLLFLCSCGKPKSLVGDWKSDRDPFVLSLTPEGKFGIVAGNDFTAGAIFGTYVQTAETLTLSSTVPVGQGLKVVYRYKWLATDKIELESDNLPSVQLTRIGPGNLVDKTATDLIPSPGAPQNPVETERQQATTCLANLKQVSLATLMYATDYDEVLPPTSWSTAILPYLKNASLYSCPTLVKAGKEGGYGFDSRLAGARLKEIKEPAKTQMYFESTLDSIGVSDAGTSTLLIPRHNGKISFAFVDGHARGLIAGQRP